MFLESTMSNARLPLITAKEQLAVDILCLLIGMAVNGTNVFDAIWDEVVLSDMLVRGDDRLRTILADGGYRGNSLMAAAKANGWDMKVVLRQEESSKKFHVIPLQWIVERSFSWLENVRRLSIYHEVLAESFLAMMQLAFTKLLLSILLF